MAKPGKAREQSEVMGEISLDFWGAPEAYKLRAIVTRDQHGEFPLI